MKLGSRIQMPLAGFGRLRSLHWLLLLMLVSYGLRLALVHQGGQMYKPDETRYRRAAGIANQISAFKLADGLGNMLLYDHHPGAKAAFTLPALLHRVAYALQPGNEQSWDQYWRDKHGDFRLSAVFLALPSVVSIGLVYQIARRAGGDELEALLAAFVLAASNSWFISSRHLLPYDMSLCLALTAWAVSLRRRTDNWTLGMMVGFLLCGAFLVYMNYWLLVGLIALLDCLTRAKCWRGMILRLLQLTLGAALLLWIYLAYNLAVAQINLPKELSSFAQSVTHGSFDEGMVFPFRYFGDTEGIMSLVWAGGLLLAGWWIWRRRLPPRHRATRWIGCLLGLYGTLTLVSSGLQVFVLYGRSVRILLPFIALVCGWSFAAWLRQRSYLLMALFVAATCAIALSNFTLVAGLRFPRDFERRVLAEYPDYATASIYTGQRTDDQALILPEDSARYLLINGSYLYPITEQSERPPGRLLLEASHPINYRPLQYEGMTPEMRDIVRRDPVMIWLIDTQAKEN
ncbi:MAG: hypothetical protein OXE46_09735 [Chloroflexi bacterium]|nr:hypothetical protein [Chloroflexota bacterium]